MLSILIPAYNYNITRLIHELHGQSLNAYVDFEILVIEDGSTQFLEENKAVADLEFCNYTVLTKNIGRSAIRNRLANEARYEHLLFLDCDSEVFMPHFIEKYLSFTKENAVVIGGTAYDPDNKSPEYSLRLKYGREREAKSALEREKDGGYSHFSTFNFLISKKIFNQIRFDETIQGYGHEDTLFGHKIAELKCDMHHIDNPLLHKGLDDNMTFIRKTEESTRNLYFLYKTGRYPFLENQSKLLFTFNQFKKRNFINDLASLFPILKPVLLRNLKSAFPSLRMYDFYKLLFLAKISRSD
ncbi:MAG: glycosyltransferase family 2 protein [Paludibacteraceae bacterium]